MVSFDPISSSACQPNSRSGRCSYPFRAGTLGTWVGKTHSPGTIETPTEGTSPTTYVDVVRFPFAVNYSCHPPHSRGLDSANDTPTQFPTSLSTALAMSEAAYVEAKRRRGL